MICVCGNDFDEKKGFFYMEGKLLSYCSPKCATDIFEAIAKSWKMWVCCDYCGIGFDKAAGYPMSVEGELIANYCSKSCRSNAAQKIISLLEKTGRED